MRSRAISSALVMIGLFVGPKATFGQPPLDSNWSPWLGCWRLMQESVRDGGDGLAPPRLPNQEANDFRVCVVPNESGPGVTMRTFADRRSVRSRTVIVDGAPHPVEETECRGTQDSQWSRDGHRLFARTNLECKDQKKRTISGITFLTLTANGPAWVDVQAAQVNGGHVVSVRRYTRTADEREPGDAQSETAPGSASPAQRAAAQPFTIEDIIEAGSKTTSESLEAALVEASPRFDLNRRTLTRLDDAGVPDSVIDLMVGLSFPGRFRVERRRQFSPSAPAGGFGGTSWDDGRWDASSGWYPYDPLWSADPYGLYYLSPFAFPYWWSGYAFDAWPANGGALVGRERKDGNGRAVQGLGYTRVSSNREAAAAGNGAGSTKSSEGTGSRQGYTAGGTSSSGSGSGSSSGSGSGGGGGSSGSGRTAQPR